MDGRFGQHCYGCVKQTSLNATTIFVRTLLPMTTWFLGMYLLTQSNNSISGLELARLLSVRPDKAMLIRQKLVSLMADEEAARKLDVRVEVNDSVLGGECREMNGA